MSSVNIGTKMRTLDVGQKQAAYTGVIVHSGQNADGEEVVYSVGTDSGSVLEVNVPNGSYALAYALLDKLKLRGYRYQPFEADGAIADPSIEIGDNITANNVPSIVMGINTNHSRLMASTLKAPFDEEVNHEWTYEPRSERQFKRESTYTRSRLTITEGQISAEVIRATDAENVLSGRITVNADNISAEVVRATGVEGTLRSDIQINADNITAEVSRATGAEGNLSSRITQNATDITAKVSKSGGSSSSFAWTLTDSSWTLTSNGSTVLKATSAGIEVSGKITATSGYIGNGSSGFEIGNTYIRNGMTSLDDTAHNGVYIGTDGIALGAGKFKVTNAGAVTASNLSITGGAISIGSNFSVDSNGNLTANTGTFKGSVYAGNILSGQDGSVDYGTFNASGLTNGTIGWEKYGIGSVYGGTDSYGYPTGSIAAGTVAYGNATFTETLDQVGINQSNIEAINGYFTGSASFNGLSASYIQLDGNTIYCDYLSLDEGTYPVVKWRYTS